MQLFINVKEIEDFLRPFQSLHHGSSSLFGMNEKNAESRTLSLSWAEVSLRIYFPFLRESDILGLDGLGWERRYLPMGIRDLSRSKIRGRGCSPYLF